MNPASPPVHLVLGRTLHGPFTGLQIVDVGMGCFWGAERRFWQLPGVHTTAVGYAGGKSPDPGYEQVCSGRTGHAEVVRVVYDPAQGLRQGNDIGSQYRSVLHCHTPEQYQAALASRDAYDAQLRTAGYPPVTTEIKYPAPEFHYAEDYHQQYLARNPNGYCGLAGTGVSCPAWT